MLRPLSLALFFAASLGAWPGRAQTPPLVPPASVQPTPTIPAAAAAPGKDVVHQLNSAFAKVFETVAPSVVIIEVTKKADSNDTSLDDLFFQPPDGNDPHHGGSPPMKSFSRIHQNPRGSSVCHQISGYSVAM